MGGARAVGVHDTMPMGLGGGEAPVLDSATPLELPRGLLIDGGGGRWRLGRRVGSGGVASVFEAEALSGGERAAIKVVHPAWAGVEEVRARFTREVSALLQAAGPRVVALRGDGVLASRWGFLPYLVMELLEGRTVAALIANGPMAPARSISVGIGALAALGEVHRRGVIHRDLKPENLFVEEEVAGAARVKLIDFGLSRPLDGGAPGRLTRLGFTVGTPSYMAPEQALGDVRADHRIDLFSMGVTLYEMLTGRLPFEGESNTVVLARILGATPRPPRQLVPSIPEPLEAVVLRALEKDPARRFDDAQQLREALAASGART